ncbi:hypothetical protein LAG90_00985 [Marinilongibacter aquaticus]|uniref:hypothetical protein n=1 Tax=Marinilongibacter aquaticus TaxID=2975157 RepID=UPI0021BD3C30|nr:hypothetical protein [Marinilongibacter aquaticus]UBM59232.1 hypothetical protein LAG90_00985 [Marinilongibacter aquaticus]
MGSYYKLQIRFDAKSKEALTEVLGSSHPVYSNTWVKIINEGSDEDADALNIFIRLIKENKGKFKEIGIKPEDISVWSYYEYEGQCNMEFEPEIMKQLGDLGIALCVSCWER